MQHRSQTTFLGLGLLATCFLVAAIVGCGQQEEIRRYQVPKAQSDAPSPHAGMGGPAVPQAAPAHGPTEGRMLGAIVLRGDEAWFFKAVGPDKEIDEHADAFRALMESVRFTEDEPAWDLPDDWRQKSGSGMRFATIEFGAEDEPIELSVIPMGIPDGDEAKCILMNVNRWRGQMGIEPLTADQIDEQTQEIPLEGMTAVLIDLKGNGSVSGMGGASAARPIAAGPKTPPAAGAAKPDASTSAAIGFDVPDNWSEGQKVVSRGGITIRHEAAFQVSEGEDRVDISVDRMPGGGSLLQNAARWQAQIGLEPGDPAELAGAIESMKIGDRAAQYVQLVGQEQSVLGAVIVGDGESWYIKLKGASGLVDREKQRFKEFLQSIRFE